MSHILLKQVQGAFITPPLNNNHVKLFSNLSDGGALYYKYFNGAIQRVDSSGTGSVFQLNNSDTISFTQSGLSSSAFINLGSLTASYLNTGTNGGATAGYVLSNTQDGNFAWVAPGAGSTTLSVSDYDKGTTFSNI